MRGSETINPSVFQKAVLDWYDKHGRKDLPWQQEVNPYRVWVSEIMLQQTQVTTVIPYFLKFMEKFPTVASLANALPDDVLHFWSGLGYYARARNLHKAAKTIHTQYSDEFPKTVEGLSDLPGIGLSTAGAILSLSMQIPAAILDGNVKRVLARVYAIPERTDKSSVIEHLWKISRHLTPDTRTHHYNQVMMDLGATVCTRGKPQCDRCPVTSLCIAYQQGNVKDYPVPKPRKTIPTRHQHVLVLQTPTQEVLLMKRPSVGIWGGLWSFPECPEPDQFQNWYKTTFHQTPGQTELLESIEHTFSHFHLIITPVRLVVDKLPSRVMEADQQLWYKPSNNPSIGLPAPIQRFLEGLYAPNILS